MKIQLKKTCILKKLNNSPDDASGFWLFKNASIKVTSHLLPSLFIFSLSFSSAETEREKSAQGAQIHPKTLTFKDVLWEVI